MLLVLLLWAGLERLQKLLLVLMLLRRHGVPSPFAAY